MPRYKQEQESGWQQLQRLIGYLFVLGILLVPGKFVIENANSIFSLGLDEDKIMTYAIVISLAIYIAIYSKVRNFRKAVAWHIGGTFAAFLIVQALGAIFK